MTYWKEDITKATYRAADLYYEIQAKGYGMTVTLKDIATAFKEFQKSGKNGREISMLHFGAPKEYAGYIWLHMLAHSFPDMPVTAVIYDYGSWP